MRVSEGTRGGKTGLILGLLFGGLFAAVGLAILFFLIVPTLRDALAARDWIPTDAFVELAELVRNTGDDSVTFRVTALYRYRFDGGEYRAERVGLMGGSDNIGDWHQRWHERLQQALESGEAITVYVNPDDPAEALVDREVRWGQLGLLFVFPLVFGAFGLGIIAFLLHGRRRNERTGVANAASRDESTFRRGVEVYSGARSGVVFLWFFTLIWNGISAPVAILAVGQELPKGNDAALIALLFPLIGLVLLYTTISKHREWRRFGRIPLVMDPYPGAIGGEMGGVLEVPVRFDYRNRFEVTLACIHSHVSGSGRHRSRSETIEWQEDGVPEATPALRGTRLAVRFEVPPGLPPSEEPSSSYYLWRLTLGGIVPGVDLERSYEIEMRAGDAVSAELGRVPLSSEHGPSAELPSRVVRVSDGAYGKVFDFQAGRHKATGALLVIVGTVFGGVGVLAANETGFLFAGIFGLIGLGAVLGGLWTPLNRLRVLASERGIISERYFLGVRLFQRRAAREALTEVTRVKGMTVSTGTRTRVWYGLAAKTRDGRTITAAESLEGTRVARELGRRMGEALGIPYRDDP